MKRSNMVQKLADILVKHYSSSDSIPNIADLVLKDLEELGMMPPTRIKNSVHSINRWETEDDDDDDRYCGAV